MKWRQIEKDFLINNYRLMGSKYCARQLNRPIYCIVTMANKLKLKVDRGNRIKNERDLKYQILSQKIDELTCPYFLYILGYLWADGWLSENKRNNKNVEIKLIKKDFDNIEYIFDKIGEWKKYITCSKLSKEKQRQFRISYYKFYNFLYENDYKIKSRVSPTKILSKIPDNLKHYWWRGFFDGDGCIAKNKKTYKLGFTGPIFYNWDFLPRNFKFFIKNRIQKAGNSSIAYLYSKNEVSKFIEYMYTGINFGLERKYVKCKEAIKLGDQPILNL